MIGNRYKIIIENRVERKNIDIYLKRIWVNKLKKKKFFKIKLFETRKKEKWV